MQEIACRWFEGWILVCPTCGFMKTYNKETISLDPMDDQRHFVKFKCFWCEEESKIIYEK